MKLTLFVLLLVFTLSSFATQSGDSYELIQSSKNTAYADSTQEFNPPEGIEKTEPHFEVNGHKFWIIIDNKRSSETYDESSEIYQYYSQIPETLLQINEDISHATVIYKDSKNIFAVVELQNESEE